MTLAARNKCAEELWHRVQTEEGSRRNLELLRDHSSLPDFVVRCRDLGSHNVYEVRFDAETYVAQYTAAYRMYQAQFDDHNIDAARDLMDNATWVQRELPQSARKAQEFLDELRKPLGSGSRLSALREGVFVCVNEHLCDPERWELQELQSEQEGWVRPPPATARPEEH